MIERRSPIDCHCTEGTAPATNVRRPSAVDPTAISRPDKARVTPAELAALPDSDHDCSKCHPSGGLDLVWRLTGDMRRVAVLFAFFSVFLAAVVIVVWLTAPHLGGIVTAAGTAGLIGGGGVLAAFGYRRRSQEGTSEKM